MARGGKRAGSGRKRGGKNTKSREIADKAAAQGITPLEYMLSILRDPHAMPADRFEAAKSAAPYIHPRLSAVEVDASHSFDDLTDDQLEQQIQRSAAEAGVVIAPRGKGEAESAESA